jgi:V/A-type H+-transporting ATPase subunit A
LSVWLGPTLLGHIFDGLLRPLDSSAEPEFDFSPVVEQDQELAGGEIFDVILTEGVALKCVLPPHVSGVVESVALAGRYGSNAVLCHVRTVTDAIVELGFFQSWLVRIPRPAKARLPADEPMITGQRILDTLFPVARGGRAALPGGFGTGKTVLQETLAKWCDADVIVYVGCSERGNEMAEVLHVWLAFKAPVLLSGLHYQP